MTPERFEAETIRRATAGDADAGMEAIRLCVSGLDGGSLSPALSFYLADCLQNIVDGMAVSRSLCLEIERGPGRPPASRPDWGKPLAALAALLCIRGYPPEIANRAMSDARKKMSGKTLDPKEARRLREKYVSMTKWSEPDLLHFCGYAIGEVLDQFPPQERR